MGRRGLPLNDPESLMPYRVRPPDALRPLINRAARELGINTPEFTIRCAEIVVEMIEAKTPTLPNLVRLIRHARKSKVTMSDPPTPLVGGENNGRAPKVERARR